MFNLTKTFLISVFYALSAAAILNYDENDFVTAYQFAGETGIDRQTAGSVCKETLTTRFANDSEMKDETEELEESETRIKFTYARDFIPTIPDSMLAFYEVHNGGELKVLARNNERVYLLPIEKFERASEIISWLSVRENSEIQKVLGGTRKSIGLNDYFRFLTDEHSVDNSYGGFLVNLNPTSKNFGEILVYSSADEAAICKSFKDFNELISELNRTGLHKWKDQYSPSPADFFNSYYSMD